MSDQRDISSVIGTINGYDELIRRVEQFANRTKVTPVATGLSIVQMLHAYRPAVEADMKREAVDAFIRDELPGLLTEAMPITIPVKNGPGPFGWDDHDAVALAAKIAELRKA